MSSSRFSVAGKCVSIFDMFLYGLIAVARHPVNPNLKDDRHASEIFKSSRQSDARGYDNLGSQSASHQNGSQPPDFIESMLRKKGYVRNCAVDGLCLRTSLYTVIVDSPLYR